jgi:pyruvate/2-oxoglutarate dehydrogenase complex dihydrolipoamide dehydrogenase (E3) component
VVLGGGYTGLEMAQAYRRFGSRVTVIEAGPQIMSSEDPDVAEEVRRILGSEGIQFLVGAEILQVCGRSGEEAGVTVRTGSAERTVEGSDILVATGRIPNTDGIGLDEAGIERDNRGYIRVNERLETTAPDAWAIGECAGSPQFTHVSIDDFRIIRDNLLGENRSTRDRLVPYCMFTDPLLAHVGLSEGDARRRGIAECRAVANEQRVAHRGHRRNAGVHESSCQRRRRPHSRLYDDRLRGRRGYDCGADRHAGEPPVSAASRRHHRTSDRRGGPWSIVLERAAHGERRRK